MSDFSVNSPDSYPERYYQRGLDEDQYLDYLVDELNNVTVVMGNPLPLDWSGTHAVR